MLYLQSKINKLKYLTLLSVGFLFLAATCNKVTSPTNPTTVKPPKNIILLIGDGMGLPQVSTAFYFQEGKSNFSRFRQIGLHQNAPARAKITDSAAGATAFSCGQKTYNGAIGVAKDSSPITTILEMAHEWGWSTGLVSTSSITHATPASFYAHVVSRSLQEDIAAQLSLSSSVDFFAGGGSDFFNKREDKKNHLETLTRRGYTIDTTALPTHPLSARNKYGYLLEPGAMPTMEGGRGDFLPRATQISIDYLSQNDKGFFLMVEGSQIDWGGHENNAKYVIEETKDFDKTIGVVLDYAEKQGNTLVIVTADHETGGLALASAKNFGRDDYRQIEPRFSTGGHTAALIPVFAYGPGAENFNGIYQNQEIFVKMLKSLGKWQ